MSPIFRYSLAVMPQGIVIMADIAPFTEAGLTVRVLETREDRDRGFRLRHAIYCQKLGWVAPRPDGLECDGYEDGSTTVGVFAGDGALVGVVRLIPPGRPFMLDHDFRPLLRPGYRLPKGPDYAEITRLATLPPAAGAARPLGVSSLLYKAIYRWACARDVRFLYLVVETRYLRHLRRRGLPCVPLGPPRRFGTGPLCIAARFDRQVFECHTDRRPTRFHHWLKADAPVSREASPWQWPGRDSAPPACAWHFPHET
ncbi:acyl-homoserine-lactone synthase [Acidiferrobacter thiooxydans]|uniref:Acyl-homoserine-lactone synthase n=2 Tax=Acidiferrobacter thiooxydans TaxID=163359 RepID=A0A368HMM0_9GAMM|nr:acyl-homoserine-lactone synthase [Acidiferrobacter thiooxydans]RCN59397.1 hypothetical protein C4900_06795 [Acidiferrobacter thiooxydans]